MVASAFHVTWKKEENHISGHNWIFKHAYMYKNAHWQSSGFMIFLSKYYIVTLNTVVGSFLGVLFLLLAVILLELHEKPRRKDLVTTKSTLKNLCEGHHFFDCTPFFLCHFLLLCSSTPSPFQSDVIA